MIRRLRNLREIKNFRAHEFRAFFLYYGPHILEGLVDEDDLEVTKHLNSIIYLSNKEVVDHNLVEILNEEVVQFLEKFKESFGEEHLTINFHELIHLPQNIAFNGSGYAISCFKYENLNSHMKKMVHGTRNPAFEIFKNHELLQNSLRSLNTESPEYAMIQRICNLTQRYAPGRKISPIYEALGQPEYSEFERIGSCSIFHRLLVRSKLWSSNDYDKDFQYKNSMIINSNTSVAFEIEKFILTDGSNEVKA